MSITETQKSGEQRGKLDTLVRCKCGHFLSDHNMYGTAEGGVCAIDGCDCLGFEDASCKTCKTDDHLLCIGCKNFSNYTSESIWDD